jgi:phage shock protein E
MRRLLFALAALAGGCLGTSNVTRVRARELVAKGAYLVDVRSPSEFAEGHALPAINIPLDALPVRAGELDRSRPVIVYCHTGVRAAIAARRLEKAGFTVYNLGTLGHWNSEPIGPSPSFE